MIVTEGRELRQGVMVLYADVGVGVIQEAGWNAVQFICLALCGALESRANALSRLATRIPSTTPRPFISRFLISPTTANYDHQCQPWLCMVVHLHVVGQ